MIQDSSQIDEPPSSTRSDLVEVVCEPTDNKVKSSATQRLSSFNSSLVAWLTGQHLKRVAPVPVVTESEAGRLLAARIPQELFDDILFYVNVDRVSQRHETLREYGRDLIRNRREPSAKDILTDLKQCSLVCLFWANRCREHIFSGRTLQIKSYEDAKIVRRYVVGGCQRLTPVHRLISGIQVYQYFDSRTSFLHLLYLPAIQDKLVRFSINGPVPDGFNPAKLDTPHWGIPPCIVVPSSFLQNTTISLDDVHLPSFHHVAKYIRHFTCATYIEFKKITWDGQTPTYSLPQASNTITCQRRPLSLRIEVLGDCTTSVHLALTALMLNPNCPLHRLSDEERVWMIKFMTLLWGDKPDPDVFIEFNVSEQATTMELGRFHFVFEEAPASTDRPVSALSVVGMHAYIYGRYAYLLATSFDALVNHARTHPAIRALVLLFDSFALLQESMKPFVEVLTTLAIETIEIVLAYEEEEKKGEEEQHGGRKKPGRVLGVDLVTLKPSGRIWADVSKYVSRSNAILRRELKKRR